MRKPYIFQPVKLRSVLSFAAVEPLECRLALTAVNGLIHTVSTMPNASGAGISSAVVGSQVFCAVGDGVDIYNAATGKWTAADLSQARTDITAASIDNLALFAGGRIEGGTASNVVDIYNGITKRWSTSKMPDAMFSAQEVTIDNQAIFIDGTGAEGPLKGEADIFNAANGRWSRALLANLGARMSVVKVGSLVLFAGGTTVFTAGGNTDTNAVYIYDSLDGKFSISALSTARDRMASAAAGNYAIFAGGSGSTSGDASASASSVVDIYNARTGQWTTSSLPTTNYGFPGVTAGNEAVFAENYDGATMSKIDAFNANAPLLTQVASVPPWNPTGGATLGNDAIFFDGFVVTYPLTGTVNIAAPSLVVYDTSNGHLSSLPLAIPRTTMASATVGSTLILAGGETWKHGGDIGTPSNAVDVVTDPSLTGIAVLKDPTHVRVTLTNLATTLFPGGDSIAVYASVGRTLDRNAVLLGTVDSPNAILPGASETVTVPISVPDSIVNGQYHLLAAIGPKHQLVQAVSDKHTTPLGGESPSSVVLAHATESPFSSAAINSQQVWDDARDDSDYFAKQSLF